LHANIILIYIFFNGRVILFDETPTGKMKIPLENNGIDVVCEISGDLDVVVEKRHVGVLAEICLKQDRELLPVIS